MTSRGQAKDDEGYHRRRYLERPSRRSPDERRREASLYQRHSRPQSFQGWLGQTETIPDLRVVYEPKAPITGPSSARGAALVKVNPRQARRFAEATGKLAKTDRMDAAMLARMGALLELEARPVRSAILNDLKDLHMAREALVKNRTAARNRAKNLTLAILKRHNTEQLRQIERQMIAIEKEIMLLIRTIRTLQAASTPCLDSGPVCSHRLRAPDRHAGTRHTRSRAGSLARRPGTRRTAVRRMDRPRLHPRRPGQCPAGPKHAATRRNALQSRSQGKIRPAKGRRKSTKSCHHSDRAKTHRSGKRAAHARQKMGAVLALTNTDTLAGKRSARFSTMRC